MEFYFGVRLELRDKNRHAMRLRCDSGLTLKNQFIIEKQREGATAARH